MTRRGHLFINLFSLRSRKRLWRTFLFNYCQIRIIVSRSRHSIIIIYIRSASHCNLILSSFNDGVRAGSRWCYPFPRDCLGSFRCTTDRVFRRLLSHKYLSWVVMSRWRVCVSTVRQKFGMNRNVATILTEFNGWSIWARSRICDVVFKYKVAPGAMTYS